MHVTFPGRPIQLRSVTGYLRYCLPLIQLLNIHRSDKLSSSMVCNLRDQPLGSFCKVGSVPEQMALPARTVGGVGRACRFGIQGPRAAAR